MYTQTPVVETRNPNILCTKYEFTNIFAGTDAKFVNLEEATFWPGDNTKGNPWLGALLGKKDNHIGYKIRFYVYDDKFGYKGDRNEYKIRRQEYKDDYEAIIMKKEGNQLVLLQHKKDLYNTQIKLDERWIRITL